MKSFFFLNLFIFLGAHGEALHHVEPFTFLVCKYAHRSVTPDKNGGKFLTAKEMN